MRDPVGHTDPSDAAAAAPGARAGGVAGGRKARRSHRPPLIVHRFLRFAAVGASGVVVNALLLLLFVEGWGWPVLLASLLSIEVSTISNWSLNRAWTWRDRREPGSLASSLGRYHAVAVGGMVLQWSVLAALVHTVDLHYLLASLAGVAAGTLWNFLGNDQLAFALRDGASSRTRRAAWYATSFLLQLAVAAVLTHPWDTFVFSRSVGDFLTTGVTPYEIAAQAPAYIYPGGSLPLTAQWYAYPPLPLLLMSATYAPVAFGAVTTPWLGRILLKLPFLLGTLGFAWATRRLVAATGSDRARAERVADRAERWILLNPLFLVVAGVWGQFEALLLMLLVLAVLALRSGRLAWGGLAYGGALLLKIFPLYIGPILLIHLVRTRGWAGAFRFFVPAGAVFAAVTLPFLLLEPHGTLQQVFLMHAERPPARFAPVAALYLAGRWLTLNYAGFPSVETLAAVFSRLSFALTALVLGALAAAYGRREPSERNLLLFLGLAMTGGLLATKVLNEQYTLLPLGLLAAAQFHARAAGRPWPRLDALLAAGTWAMAVAAMVDNVHFLRFLPPDVAARVLGDPVPVATRHLAEALGLSVLGLRHVLGFVTGIGLVVPLVLALRLLAAPVRDGLVVLEHAVERVPSLVRGALPGRAVVAAVAAGALLILPLSAFLAPASATMAGAPASAELPDRAVLGHVRTDWYNPTNDPEIAAGTWAGVAAQPLAGHYNTNARKAVDDLTALRAAGVDGILVQAHPDYTSGANSVRRVAESLAMPYGLAVDLRDLADGEGRVRLDEATAHAARELLGGPADDWWTGRWHLTHDGKALVAVAGVDALRPGFSAGESRLALRAYAQAHALPADDATLAAVAASPPATAADLADGTAVAAVWSEAYGLLPGLWWRMALDGAAPGPLALVADAPLPDVVGSWAGDLDANQPAALDGAPPGALRWATLGGPLGTDSYRPAWLKALWAEPTAVVVPWNDFAHGRAVEPTREHGDVLLRATAEWAARFHEPERPALPSDSPAGPQESPADRVADRVREGLPPTRPSDRSNLPD